MTRPDTASMGDTYFFLSYAHSVPPSANTTPAMTDPWVKKFYEDLSAAVARHPHRDKRIDQGFYDGLLDPGADLKHLLTDALSAAHVFVPLYSPQYFSNGWAIGERASFLTRLTRLGPVEAALHILPVLWTPLPPWQSRTEVDDALAVVDGTPGVDKTSAYEQNGLRALCRLATYRDQYQAILAVLADRIVAVPKRHPLREPRAADLITDHKVEDRRATLVVTVVARGAGVGWHPYADQGHALPIADYVAATAERLGLPSRVIDLPEVVQTHRGPVVLLVDSSADGGAVRSAVRHLPRWTVPMVLPGSAEPGSPALREIGDILRAAQLHEVEPVRGVNQIARVVPLAVVQARKQYLEHLSRDGRKSRPRMSLRPGPVTDGQRGQEEDR